MDRDRSLCPSGSHPQAGVPVGVRPAPIIGVGFRGARWSALLVRSSTSRWTRCGLIALVLVLAVVATPMDTAQAESTAASSVPLTVLSQSSWVVPGQSFDLKLRTGDGAPPTGQLGVAVSVYSCLSSVSAFDQSVSAVAPSGTPISSTATPIPVAGLPSTANGEFDLSMPVGTQNAGTATPADGFAIHLTAGGGRCAAYQPGVYPVRVQLVNTSSGQVIGGITTHLVYTDAPAATQKLRVALILPIQTTMAPSSAPTSSELVARPQAALEQPAAATLSSLDGTVDAIAANRSAAPLTLDVSPQTVKDLADSGHQSTVNQLAALAGAPNIYQFASAPFAPVNAAGLVNAGLSSELAAQVARGSQVLDTAVTHPSASTAQATPTGALGAWFTNDGVDADTVAQLQADGYSQLVLPASSVSTSPVNFSTSQPFVVTAGRGASMTAMTSSADLAARFVGAPRDPVLAAHQLVAELAQIYYEQPNDVSPRVVVAMAPSGWSDNPAFVQALLTALDGNPIIQPVTTSEAFAAVPTVTCRTGCKPNATAAASGLPVASIRLQRQRISGFSVAAPTAHDITGDLGDLVLSGESDDLRPHQQSAVLRNTSAALNAQLDQVAVAGDRTITLTSLQGSLPVTILSSAAYPVTASLTVTSDKLLFPNGKTEWTEPAPITLSPGHQAHIFTIPVKARTSGTFKVDIALRSPDGTLLLSSGQSSIRSTATSVVGVVLSLGAVAVLAVWWIRTSRKRRSLRRADELEPETTGEGSP